MNLTQCILPPTTHTHTHKYTRTHTHTLSNQSAGRTIPSLHVWGTADDINPPELARKMESCFPEAQEYVHGGGHIVPSDPKSVAAYAEFLRQFC